MIDPEEISACIGFDWDEANASKVKGRYGVSTEECEEAFGNAPLAVSDDARHSDRERRHYAMGHTDASLQPLSGSASYVLHMPVAPPATEGWTLTAYDAKGALIPNALDRYQLSDASKLAKNADGSVDIYIRATQPANPAQAQNWLPVAAGQGFEVIWRLIAPKPDAIAGILDGSGWQPPALTAVP